MYRVALVQNQSEMAHYAHADARMLVGSLGYQIELFTAENISSLGDRLCEPGIDAVVIGSNALNDRIIREAFIEESLGNGVRELLDRGGGVLALHQQRLASEPGSGFGFLPEPFDTVESTTRPEVERVSVGELRFPEAAMKHVARLFPRVLMAKEVKRVALSSPSIPGLYWHFWDYPSLANWDILLEDSSVGDSRPLVIVSKETSAHRIVLAALPLDWHDQIDFLANLLVYSVTGRRSTAILRNQNEPNSTYSYFVESMEARRSPFELYDIGISNDVDRVSRLIGDGVHGTLVLLDGLDLTKLPVSELGSQVRDRVSRGELKLVTIRRDDEGLPEFTVNSREAYAKRLLAMAELATQSQLRVGNIDGSFWLTVESLQALDEIPETSGTYESIVNVVIDLASTHDRDGSHDEVFGSTCALYWLRSRFLGEEDRQTQSSLAWLRGRIDSHKLRDRALAYSFFANRGVLSDNERLSAQSDLESVDIESCSEFDLSVFLRSALAVPSTRAHEFADALTDRQSHGKWIDTATTATTASLLLDFVSESLSRGETEGLDRARESVREAVVTIQDALPAPADMTPFPWDNKASTTLRCLEAWLKFDRQINLPVYEVMDQLAGFDLVSRELATMRSSLSVLDELSDENARLHADLVASSEIASGATRERVEKRLAVISCIAISYLLATVLLAATQFQNVGLGALLNEAFVKPAGFHLGLLAAIGALVVVPWGKLLGKLERA